MRNFILRSTLAAAVLVILAGGAWWDAYLRDHPTYYRYYAKRWGVFVGLGPISEAQARTRAVSYRFLAHGRFGAPYRMEVVNGSGYCPMISPMALYIGADLTDRDLTARRTCAWEFEVAADGRVRREQGLDFMGRRTYALQYSGSDATIADYVAADRMSGPGAGATRIVLERTESGPRAGLDTIMRFQDDTGRARQNRQRVYGVRSEYDDDGRRIRTTYLDYDGRPMADREGIVTIVAQYNEQGDLASRSYLDASDGPTRTSAGYASVAIGYDGVGNEVTQTTLDPFGKPTARPQGYAEVRYTYEQRGNVSSISYFDAAGRATRIQNGLSTIRQVSDNRGWPIEIAYLDEFDRPAITTAGHAMERREYDAESNLVRQQHLDLQGMVLSQTVTSFAEGHPVEEIYQDGAGRAAPRPLGHSGLRQAWREGLVSERVYLDTERRPMIISRKFAKQNLAYDANGNLVEIAYRDDQDRPVLIDEGYATVKRQFNERGDADGEIFLGLDNQPIVTAFGYSMIRVRHDDRGRALDIRYFGAGGRAVWPQKDCAFDRTYDAFGRERTTRCMRDDMPAPHPDGWTRREIDHDPLGNPVRERYFGTAGAPVRDRNGIARLQRSYDAWGNLVDQRFFDERDVAVKGSNGCARIVQKFNRLNSNIGEACLDANGDPSERTDGVSRVVIDRDVQDRVTRSTFYMLHIPVGWPTRIVRQDRDTEGRVRKVEYVDDAGVVRLRQDVDERSRAIGSEYFNVQGQPQRGPAGFAKSRVVAFDEFGGADMEFQDESGNPVLPVVLVISVKEGGAGARAGLRPFDLILRYDGRDVHYGEFAAVQRVPGDVAREIVVLRGNAVETLQAEPRPLDIETEPVERP